MFGSIERSWNLAKESMGVIRKDPELMIFPSVSFIVALAATLQSVYTAALYEYATGGKASTSFSQNALDSAFRPKH